MKLLVSLATVLLAGAAVAVPAVLQEGSPARRLQSDGIACRSDIERNGVVNTEDLLTLLSAFGRDASGCDPDGAPLRWVGRGVAGRGWGTSVTRVTQSLSARAHTRVSLVPVG